MVKQQAPEPKTAETKQPDDQCHYLSVLTIRADDRTVPQIVRVARYQLPDTKNQQNNISKFTCSNKRVERTLPGFNCGPPEGLSPQWGTSVTEPRSQIYPEGITQVRTLNIAPAPVEKPPVLTCIEQRPSGHNARYSRKLTLFKVGQPQKIRKRQTHLICHLESVHCSLLEGNVRCVEAQ